MLNAAVDYRPAVWTLASLRQNGLRTFWAWDTSIRQGERLPFAEQMFLLSVESAATHEVSHRECIGACPSAQPNYCSEDDECVH